MQILTDDDLGQFLAEQESQWIGSPSTWTEDVIAKLEGKDEAQGHLLPWSKTHPNVKLGKGQVSIWCGINGHGKSQFLGQVCAWGLKTGKWCLASMEMTPQASLYRMCRQIAGNKYPSKGYVKSFLEWTDGRLWIYDQSDSVDRERIVAMILYCARKLTVDHVIIDSLIKCGIPREDYEKQAQFVDRLCWVAKREGIHIHLVHHIRKGENEYKRPNKFDLRGAGELSDLVDNVFIVHRNKLKEHKLKNPETSQRDLEKFAQQADQTLSVDKQRHGEWEGTFNFWFHEDSMQYTPSPDKRPMPFEF